MDAFSKMRTPFFWAALACIFVAVLLEVGSAGWIKAEALDGNSSRPGLGITYLALFDGLLLWILFMMGVSLVIPSSTHARIQGLVTLVFSIIYVILAFFALLAVFFALVQMVILFLAVPFGTIAYLGIFGTFSVGAAAGTLGVIMTLKLALLVLLILAHQGFLKNKFLLLFIGLSVLLTFVLTFLHSFPPVFLVSITDALGALISAVIAIVMTIVFLIGALPGIVRAIG